MAKYPRHLRQSVLHGLTNQLRVNGRIVEGCFEIQIGEADIMGVMYGPHQGYSGIH